jgi:hypothetical protein
MSTSRNPSNSSTSSDCESDIQTDFGPQKSDEVKWHKDIAEAQPAESKATTFTLPVSEEEWLGILQRFKDTTIDFNKWREKAFVGYLKDEDTSDIKTGFVKLLARTAEMDSIITIQDVLINQLQKYLNKYIENEKQQPDLQKSQVPV